MCIKINQEYRNTRQTEQPALPEYPVVIAHQESRIATSLLYDDIFEQTADVRRTC